jgi:hypothetical protein
MSFCFVVETLAWYWRVNEWTTRVQCVGADDCLRYCQAYDHGEKPGLKDKQGKIFLAFIALLDTDSDNFITSAELRTYATKVIARLLSHQMFFSIESDIFPAAVLPTHGCVSAQRFFVPSQCIHTPMLTM